MAYIPYAAMAFQFSWAVEGMGIKTNLQILN